MKGKGLGRLEVLTSCFIYQLLNWLNEFIEADYPKIEMCCDGVAYCQIIDSLHPNQVPMHKLNCNLL